MVLPENVAGDALFKGIVLMLLLTTIDVSWLFAGMLSVTFVSGAMAHDDGLTCHWHPQRSTVLITTLSLDKVIEFWRLRRKAVFGEAPVMEL